MDSSGALPEPTGRVRSAVRTRRSSLTDAGLPRASILFRRIRRGLRVRAALRALEPAAAVALCSWLAGVVADAVLSLSAGSRIFALAATCAAAAGTFLWCLARGAVGRIGPVYIATRVEALYPNFAGRLIAAVELAGSRLVPQLVPQLVNEQAEALVGEVDPARVVAAEAQLRTAHKYLLWSMALVLAAALLTGRDFPDLAARSLFPWLSPEAPDAAFFWVRPRAVEVEEGERFTVEASLRGLEPERVFLELALFEDDGSGGDEKKDEGAVRVEMNESPVPHGWAAEAGPVEGPGRFRLVAEYGRKVLPLESQWFPIRLLRRPRTRSMTVRYVYPKYTGRPDRSEPGGAVDAPVGTTATVELVPEHPLARATVVIEGRRRAEMQRVAAPGGPGRSWSSGRRRRPDQASRRERGEAWRFRLGVTRSGSYRIELESPGGVSARIGPYPVIARPDRAPRCDASFIEPSSDRPGEVSSRGAAFRVRAADDFGLEELVLVVRRGARRGPVQPSHPERLLRSSRLGSTALTGRRRGKRGDTYYIPVPGFAAGAREFSRELCVPPQVLPIEPGVTYTYYVRAADGFPPAPHLSTSPERTFRVARSARPEAMLAGARRKKRRPPLLEPRDDEPEEPLGPRAGSGSGGGGRGQRPSRSLAGLDDGEKRRSQGGKPKERPKASSSPYASAPGLGAGGQEKEKGKEKGKDKGEGEGRRGGESPKETASTAGGRPGQERRRREKPQLPGQGGPPDAGKAPQRERTAAGGSSGSGSGSRPGGGGSGGAGTGSGGRPGPRREAPDATGSGPEGGGRANAGLKQKKPRDGGVPTGAETGVGVPMPETVDDEAVAALTAGRDELGDVRISPRTPGFGKDAAGRGERPTDLGRGSAREIAPAEGRDRVAISKDDIPTPAVVRSHPVGRMYRALVSEYFRRLEELAEER